MKTTMKTLLAAAALLAAGAASAQAPQPFAGPTWSGWLCCSLRTDGKWISDINYANGPGDKLLPAGTPVQVTGYGRQRVLVTIDGKPQAIGNDYSRELGQQAFAQRYVLKEDPAATLNAMPPKVRQAVLAGRVMKGMTREQARMAVGWPVTSENPNPEGKILRHWLSTEREYQLLFDDAGRLQEISTDPATRSAVVME